jgi:hypothetical protein
MDLAGDGGEGHRICGRWGLPVGEDTGRWCAAAEDEERGRDKGGVERGVSILCF